MTNSGLWEHIEKLVAESHYVIIAVIIIILIILLIDNRFKYAIKGMFKPIFIGMDIYKDRIDTVIKLIGLVSIIIAILSFRAETQKKHEDSELVRKQTALRIVMDVQHDIETGLVCASFLSDLSLNPSSHQPDELDKIFQLQELVINEADMDKLDRCLAGETEEKKRKDFKEKVKVKGKGEITKLTKQGSYYVFHRATHDLNLLETVARAYYSNIVDKETIDDLFGYTLKSPTIQGFTGKLNPSGLIGYEYLAKYIEDHPSKKQPSDDNK